MSLVAYHRKRDSSATPEPEGKKPRRRADRLYVMHKHRARNLHYDLRLEVDGVLKSWAAPKGPSLRPRDKRLAIQVADHPIEYGDVEGLLRASSTATTSPAVNGEPRLRGRVRRVYGRTHRLWGLTADPCGQKAPLLRNCSVPIAVGWHEAANMAVYVPVDSGRLAGESCPGKKTRSEGGLRA